MGSGVSSYGKTKEAPRIEASTPLTQTIAVAAQSTHVYTHQTATCRDEDGNASVSSSGMKQSRCLNGTEVGNVTDATRREIENCDCDEENQNIIETQYTERSGRSDSIAAEMFANTAMSLGMDNDDLLFNLLYFGETQASSFGAVMEGVQQETLALHSENNTPYKLKPASASAISGLQQLEYGIDFTNPECECAVCKDDIEVGSTVLQIPICQHFFHEECLLRWIKLQGWCPVCRAPMDASVSSGEAEEGEVRGLPEAIPEETPSGQYEYEDTPDDRNVSPRAHAPPLRLFEGDEEVSPTQTGGYAHVPVGGAPEHSPRLDTVGAGKQPGSTKCVL